MSVRITSKKGPSGNKFFYFTALSELDKFLEKYPNFDPAICGSVGRILNYMSSAYDVQHTDIDYSVGDLDLIIDESKAETIPDCFVKTDQSELVKGSGYTHYRYKSDNGFLKICLFVVKHLVTRRVFRYDVQTICEYGESNSISLFK